MRYLSSFLFAILLLAACNGPKQVTTTPDVDFRATAPEPGPAPTISLKEPATFTLDNGLTVIVVENHKLPTVNTSLYFDIPSLVEGEKAGLTSFFGPVMRAGTENFSKEAFDEELDYHAINMNTGSRSVSFSALKKQLPKAMELMTEVLFNPTFSNQDELDKLVKQSVTGIQAASKNPDAIMTRVGNALLYGTDHPWGEYATAETYQNVSLADLKNHYDTYFKPNIAYLTIVGDVTVAEAKALAQNNFSNWSKGDIPSFSYPTPVNADGTEVIIVDLPNASQSNVYVSNLQDLSKADDDFFAAILGNHVLGGSASAKLFLNLREDKAYTYGSYSQMGNDDEFKSRFNAYAKVRNEVTDSSVMELMKELKSITSTPLSAKEIKDAKSEQTGRFALGLERPATVANFARTVMLEDLDGDFYSNYLKNLNAQTPATVLSAMKKYIKPDNAKIIIVGKAADIADNVKALGYPVKFYDIWANEVADPTIKVDTGDAQAIDVVNKYIESIGGKDKWATIKTAKYEYGVEVAGVPMQMMGDIKAMAPNKSLVVISAPGMGEVNRVVFDGESGYNEQMGQQMPMEEAQIAAAKNKNIILEELALTADNVAIDNLVDVNGEKAYKVIVTDAAGKKSERYYSQSSGLLLQTIDTTEAQGQTFTTTVTYSDYQDFGGLKLAKTMKMDAGGQQITMTLQNAIFNEGVTAADFK